MDPKAESQVTFRLALATLKKTMPTYAILENVPGCRRVWVVMDFLVMFQLSESALPQAAVQAQG